MFCHKVFKFAQLKYFVFGKQSIKMNEQNLNHWLINIQCKRGWIGYVGFISCIFHHALNILLYIYFIKCKLCG